ncbi:cytochrome C [Falsiroseomonas bella]|uniref:Cytochrome C n=1 Tax=Falsiroseomonas bella TaxID=2184016 RepID=A0A317FI71_9PROT|nr:cytochrome c [Falsiroseomonas bella]PWS37338.1 cytochrome C [Falsiroseomonas bella]
MSRSIKGAAIAAGMAVALAGGSALAQQQQQPGRGALYRPFEAPSGERTRADVAWPAPGGIALPRPIPGIGRAATSQEIAGWDIAVRGDGHNLPPGSGTAQQGEELYVQHCSACHGDFGEGLERWPALMGGRGSLRGPEVRRTVGSYWQHAPGVFDYIRRAMPYPAPQSLTNDEYYAITAYVLFLNELIPDDAEMNRETLPRVQMPNRDGFVLEARPDTPDEACMTNCRQGRPVTMTGDSRRFVEPGSGSGFSEPQ